MVGEEVRVQTGANKKLLSCFDLLGTDCASCLERERGRGNE